ncbi:MAG: hypothetical protein JWN92_649 [Candidatus Acidoferrum typicum]|nr:hypothetical protein [Candidatus Acidoferrum typicum]
MCFPEVPGEEVCSSDLQGLKPLPLLSVTSGLKPRPPKSAQEITQAQMNQTLFVSQECRASAPERRLDSILLLFNFL